MLRPAASARFCAAACLAWHCLLAINLGAWRELSSLVSNFNQISKHADEQKIQQGTTVLDVVQVKFLLQKLDGALEKVSRCLFGVTAE